MSGQIYAVTFKDADGKWTRQETGALGLIYDTPREPCVNLFASYIERELVRLGFAAEVAEAKERLLKDAEERMRADYGYSADQAVDPSLVKYWVGACDLSYVLGKDTFKVLPWRNKAWRYDATCEAQENPVPWSYEPIEDHFARLVWEEDTNLGRKVPMVRYYASEEHGEIRKSTPMKPGRYLQRFYPSLDGETIREWVTLIDKAVEVRFAVTADEIERVYLCGPSSCMSHKPDDYDSFIHPVRVYGDSDLQLAYLSFAEPTSAGFKASARALVWPEKKRYGRIYGDTHRMKTALEAAGYTSGNLRGAKIKRIVDEYEDDNLVVPYIDGDGSVEDCGDYLKIGGNLCADSTTGLVPMRGRAWCPGLDEYVEEDEEDFIWVADRDESCSTDYVRSECFLCDYHNEYYTFDHGYVMMANGERWSQDAFASHGGECERTGRCYPSEDLITLSDSEEVVCESWAEANAHYVDGEWYLTKPEDEAEAESDMEEAA